MRTSASQEKFLSNRGGNLETSPATHVRAAFHQRARWQQDVLPRPYFLRALSTESPLLQIAHSTVLPHALLFQDCSLPQPHHSRSFRSRYHTCPAARTSTIIPTRPPRTHVSARARRKPSASALRSNMRCPRPYSLCDLSLRDTLSRPYQPRIPITVPCPSPLGFPPPSQSTHSARDLPMMIFIAYVVNMQLSQVALKPKP